MGSIIQALEEFAEHHSDYQPSINSDQMDSNESKDELQSSNEETSDIVSESISTNDTPKSDHSVESLHPTIHNIALSHDKISELITKLKPIVARRKGLELSINKLDEEYNSLLKEIHDHTINILNETNNGS